MGLVLLAILMLLLLAGLPRWSYGQFWGYGPSGAVAVALVVVAALVVTGYIPRGF